MAANFTNIKFTECCSQTEIFFSISTSQVSSYLTQGDTYLFTDVIPYEGSGGILENGTCYTYSLTGDPTSSIPDYPLAPLLTSFDEVSKTCGESPCPSCFTSYQLTDCSNPDNIKYTCSDLSEYVNYVIKLRNCATICWKVSTTGNPVNPQEIDEIIGFFLPIDLGTVCYYSFAQIDPQVLANVDYATIVINGTTYTFDPFVNGPTLANEIDALNLGDCTYDITSNVLSITGNETYGPLTLVIEGEVPQLIVVPKTCQLLFEYNCAACLPEPPVPVIPKAEPRKVRPGYFIKNPCLTTEYVEKVNCTFSNQVYDQMISVRYGVSSCCEVDVNKWDIKKQIVDFELITIPKEEVHTPRTCYCYTITVITGTANFKYINCEGNWCKVTLTKSVLNVCSQNKPQADCVELGVIYEITSSTVECETNDDCEQN